MQNIIRTWDPTTIAYCSGWIAHRGYLSSEYFKLNPEKYYCRSLKIIPTPEMTYNHLKIKGERSIIFLFWWNTYFRIHLKISLKKVKRKMISFLYFSKLCMKIDTWLRQTEFILLIIDSFFLNIWDNKFL